VLDLLDNITERMVAPEDARSDGFRVLRQAMAYRWSVAVVALPNPGLERFMRWQRARVPDSQWIARENLKKDRLRRVAG
jgi:hypothetical protein